MQKTAIPDNEDGQVAIEFIVVISFALGITFLFFSQAFNATDGYLVHYANFMASRTYLSSDQGSNKVDSNITYAAGLAEEVYESYPLKALGIISKFEVITFNKGSGLFSGTTAKFEKTLNVFGTIGVGDKAKLLSESFLGKEPVRKTCFEMICEAMTGNRNSCETNVENLDITLYDNGC